MNRLSSIFKSKTIKEFIVDFIKFKGCVKLIEYKDKYRDNLFKERNESIEFEIPMETFFEDIILDETN